MDIEAVRNYCLAFPHATENIQWGNDLCFKLGGKLFAVIDLESRRLSFQVTPEEFVEFTEREGIRPAPYVARYHWIVLDAPYVLSPTELKGLLAAAYERSLAKLPKKIRLALDAT